jgi:hypothetical protein
MYINRNKEQCFELLEQEVVPTKQYQMMEISRDAWKKRYQQVNQKTKGYEQILRDLRKVGK